MGSLRRLKGETRSCFALARLVRCNAFENDNHFHFWSERSERCLLIMIRNKGGSAPEKKSERSERYGFPHPHWGLTASPKIRIGQTKLCHFFREVDHYKGITRRTTKVSLHRVFTFFIRYVAISSPYQFSFTMPAIHVKKVGLSLLSSLKLAQGELMDILPSSCSMT